MDRGTKKMLNITRLPKVIAAASKSVLCYIWPIHLMPFNYPFSLRSFWEVSGWKIQPTFLTAFLYGKTQGGQQASRDSLKSGKLINAPVNHRSKHQGNSVFHIWKLAKSAMKQFTSVQNWAVELYEQTKNKGKKLQWRTSLVTFLGSNTKTIQVGIHSIESLVTLQLFTVTNSYHIAIIYVKFTISHAIPTSIF